jgi:hypothetical protein
MANRIPLREVFALYRLLLRDAVQRAGTRGPLLMARRAAT